MRFTLFDYLKDCMPLNVVAKVPSKANGTTLVPSFHFQRNWLVSPFANLLR